jgi:mRNA-degrading endonuclease toxin of MazEF toxin-antitoxin module
LTEVRLGAGAGLRKAWVATLDTVTTIPKQTLTRPISVLSAERLRAVDRAPSRSLGLRP